GRRRPPPHADRVRAGIFRCRPRGWKPRIRRGPAPAGRETESAKLMAESLFPSLDLLHRYNVPGPRYTSYPTAPVWREDFRPADYDKILKESAAGKEPAPLSLYIHLPFCEQLCYFCGCTVVITGSQHSLEDSYLETLEKEIQWVADRGGQGRRVVQFHLGGGTPTYFAPERLERLAAKIRRCFSFETDAEIGVEVDPRV